MSRPGLVHGSISVNTCADQGRFMSRPGSVHESIKFETYNDMMGI